MFSKLTRCRVNFIVNIFANESRAVILEWHLHFGCRAGQALQSMGSWIDFVQGFSLITRSSRAFALRSCNDYMASSSEEDERGQSSYITFVHRTMAPYILAVVSWQPWLFDNLLRLCSTLIRHIAVHLRPLPVHQRLVFSVWQVPATTTPSTDILSLIHI